jgi:BirA family transcriptional regulator, biotin operon repressor / biotin---[acetyl-CoA-carboxylase] ligase
MNTRLGILRLLADGKLHSGADIGRKLGVSRAAVHKGVKGLSANGLGVHAVAGLGYRLDAPITPLDEFLISRGREARATPAQRIEILECVDSTNSYLLARALVDPDPDGLVCLTEVQPQGRGRQGRSWVATPYENLMMSMAWRFDTGPALVAGLSLAAGVAVARALEAYGVPDTGLKWPNDVLWRERKLAGLLVDVYGEASGPCTVVVGIGVNCRISVADARRIDQPWVDLYAITETIPDRNRLAALLIRESQEMFKTFAVSGLAAYRSDWNQRHLYAHRPVRVSWDHASFEGTIEGVDDHGALRLRHADGRVQLFHSGEVSLRSVA